MNRTVQQKRADFKALHARGCFVIPNPWDVGSAKMLQGLGFKALATTSSGFAWSQGHADGAMSREAVIAHLRTLAAATDRPLNADFESGYAKDAAGVTESVRMAIDTGVAGISIEDATGDAADPLRSIEASVERMRAARAAIDATGGHVLLVGRAENFIVNRPDLADTILRLKAYSEAGADCLYAPGIRTREQITAVVAAVKPKPVNLLIGGASEFTLDEVAEMGVRRVSVGGALARTAWAGMLQAARKMATEGRFDGLGYATPGKELNEFFGR